MRGHIIITKQYILGIQVSKIEELAELFLLLLEVTDLMKLIMRIDDKVIQNFGYIYQKINKLNYSVTCESIRILV